MSTPFLQVDEKCRHASWIRRAGRRAACWLVGLAAAWVAAVAEDAAACPFCKAVRPTLAQRCESAEEALLVECESAGEDSCTFRLLKALHSQAGRKAGTSFTLPAEDLQPAPEARGKLAPGDLALLLAVPASEPAPHRQFWQSVPLNELTFAYLARMPERSGDAAQWLTYFVPYLEHAEPLLAEDAYLEFAHAPYDLVAQAAVQIDAERLRGWIQSPDVPDERKGLYGLLLGLEREETERAQNAQRLREVIERPALDLRAGFDGMLAGYLLLEGEKGLELVESRILGNDRAAEGDVRHAVSALRFHQVHARRISHERLGKAFALLLDRPGFTAEVIGDLARLRCWDVLAQVVGKFGDEQAQDPAVDRAVIGYLLACPLDEAKQALAELRRQHPRRVAEAESVLRRLRAMNE